MRLHYSLRPKIAMTLAIIIIMDTLSPLAALALTGGPSQPEVQGFKPIDATNMVDIFTGDFNYNLPLFEIEGYPVNMSYNSNPRMDDEASWVGLGWTLNPGAVNREMRGMPDDFKDEGIEKQFDMKNDSTIGGNVGVSLEILGFKALSIKQGLFWNNKKGFGAETSISASAALGKTNASASLSLTSNTQSGLDIGANIGLTKNAGTTKAKIDAGANINSRAGLKAVSFGFTIKDAGTKKANVEPNAADAAPTTTPAATSEPKATDNGDPIGFSGGISNEMGGFTYFPTNPMPMFNESFSFHLTAGFEKITFHPNVLTDGYITTQKLATTKQTQQAYGYLYQTDGQKNKNAVLDCNRDGQLAYREDMPNVPLSYGTYDNYSVAGQGVGGQYRLHRNDVGMLHNGFHNNRSVSGTLGVELGFGNLFHAGGDFAVATVDNTSEPWVVNNKMRDVIKFTENDKNYESVYFKESGEKTIDDDAFNKDIGGSNPVFNRLSKQLSTISAERQLEIQQNKQPVGFTPVGRNLQKTERAKRYNVFSYLTNAEQTKVGLDKQVKYYTANVPTYSANGSTPICTTPSVMARPYVRPHHIGEISVTKSDGSRYVFGLPAYNIKQVETSFSCNPAVADDAAYINYPTIGNGVDAPVDYKKGRDHFFESQTIPAHAHAYLLTGVLSDDYVDVTGNGISDDDLGNGVKFNYTLQNAKYKWRTPFSPKKARLMQGMKTDKKDDKASYVYGEKELWYVHSIESRNMVAQFYTSPRSEGFGVLDKNGGLNSAMGSQKLDKIKIFSKSDLLKNGTNAIPIKTVHFDYFYTLCQGVENSNVANGGKLTLKKVYFTFGNNGKGALNAYKFNYKGENNVDYKYAAEKVDRWGFYKQHPNGIFPSYIDYPYSLQNQTEADKYAGSWSLSSIVLPSGGTINVDYESDDYAYVQNKRAGQMFFIKGFTNSTNGSNIVPELYNAPSFPFGFGTPNEYMAVEVPNMGSLSTADVKNLFFEDVKDMFFKAKVQLTKDQNTSEFVSGYVSYSKDRVVYSAPSNPNSPATLFIPVTNISEGATDKIHPITMAALQMLRLNLSDLAYDRKGSALAVNDVQKSQVAAMVKGLVGFATDLIPLFKGFSKDRVQKGWCKTVDVVKKNAWVRLANPTFKKLGGGSRVKSVRISDMWSKDGSTPSTYGQKFSYTTVRNGKTISSGVASYEPALGGDEISLKQPLPYSDKVKLAPDNSYYTETPIGESFFPSPGIGYSEVRVESTNAKGEPVGTGYTVSKFYTAKDFPTITDFTNIVDGTVKVKPDIISKIFKFNVVDQRGVSQGFVVETNDMHGKPKEEAIYNQNGSLVSATNYYYKTDDPNATALHLKNKVDLIKPDGSIVNRDMGVEIDLWQEMQEESSRMQNIGVAVNVDGFLGFIFPIVIPMPLPIYQNQNKGIKTSITSKLVRRMGILDKIVKTVDGSTQSTQNIAYDIETGDVLLTRTENEYNDPLYNFTYPAHWAYDGMGSAYKNIGNLFKGVKFDAVGQITEGVSAVKDYFVAGDELILTKEASNTIIDSTYYMTPYPTNTGIVLRVFDGNGNPFNGLGAKYTVKIKRSGRRNKSALPIGSIASLENPLLNNDLSKITGMGTRVIQADAKEYNDVWRMRCKKDTVPFCDNDSIKFASQSINPYTVGTRGNWRGWRGFIHYNDRNVTSSTAASNIRRDGYIPSFAPYWTYDIPTKFWIRKTGSNWVRSDSIHHFDQRGNEIESSDANNIVSSASFGFNNTQVVAVTANSPHQEMTYDSFEDYDFINNCNGTSSSSTGTSKNIEFYKKNKAGVTLDATTSHTGKYSMALNGGAQLKISSQLAGYFCPQPLALPFTQNSSGASGSRVQTDGSNSGMEFLSSNLAASAVGTSNGRIYNKCDDCLPEFGLMQGKRYVMSAWVASESSLKTNERPLSIKVSINGESATIPVSLRPQGPVIEGWQKLEATFTAPETGRFMTFTFTNLNLAAKGYIDDVRILPFNAKMKAYAYDQKSRRLMAELDENHYATFYEYDDEGQLVRIKRETETGIQTVKEARNYLVPQ